MRVVRMNTEVLQRENIRARDLLTGESRALEMYQYLTGSPKVQSYLRSANRMAVSRLGYTDHGAVHAEVATWNALKVFDILDETFRPNVVAEGIGDSAGGADPEHSRVCSISLSIWRSRVGKVAAMTAWVESLL